MARFRTPANVLLRRAQLILMLVTLLPTVMVTGLGIAILAGGGGSRSIVIGLLVIVFCTTALTGYILSSIFVSRGASQARFQNDFLNSVSHELRTPLTSISMFIEALGNDRLTDEDEKRQCLELLSKEVLRLGELVERLLSLSRIEAGQSMLQREPVKASELIDDSISAFEAATLGDRVAIAVELKEPDKLTIRGDRAALAQALTNLLVNAWKYTDPSNREISITAEADDKFVEIAVIDNGHGIPRAEHKRIFERFERGKAAIDGTQPGSGLGLAIVRAVMRAHRGKIEVRSRPGEGSEFRLRLRRWRKPEETSQESGQRSGES